MCLIFRLISTPWYQPKYVPKVRQIVVSTANLRYELHFLDPSCLNKELILLLYIVVIYENRISIFCDSAVNDFMQTKSQFNVGLTHQGYQEY